MPPPNSIAKSKLRGVPIKAIHDLDHTQPNNMNSPKVSEN